MTQRQTMEARQAKQAGRSVWFYVGGAALVLFAAGVVTVLPDIKRYLRISMM